jgi:hypothetical protein
MTLDGSGVKSKSRSRTTCYINKVYAGGHIIIPAIIVQNPGHERTIGLKQVMGEVIKVCQMTAKIKDSKLIFVGRLDSLSEMRLGGVAEQGQMGNIR